MRRPRKVWVWSVARHGLRARLGLILAGPGRRDQRTLRSLVQMPGRTETPIWQGCVGNLFELA